MKIGIILGSIRDDRLGERVYHRVTAHAKNQLNWDIVPLDLKELQLPLYHDTRQPYDMHGTYPDSSVQRWSQAVGDCDGFIIITPEYNHGLPASLKNALDWLYPEWNNKAATLVGYSSGIGGGIRAVEQLRLTCGHLGIATCQQVTTIARAQDHFTDSGEVIGQAVFDGALGRQLTQLTNWAGTLQQLRNHPRP